MENEMPEVAWLFIHEGERFGPVSFAELKTKATEGQLNPRLDLAWRHGMPEWLPAGQIEGLFDRIAPPPPPSASEVIDEGDEYSAELQMLRQSEWPGARRRSFLLMTIVFPFVWFIPVFLLLPNLQGVIETNLLGILTFALALFPLLVAIVFFFKRLNNLGMHPAWFLGYLVPIINLWVGYRLIACPAGYAYHKKLDSAGWILAILYWGIILLGLISFAISGYLIFTGAADADLPAALEEFLKKIEQSQSEP